jgi:hypothetical protein
LLLVDPSLLLHLPTLLHHCCLTTVSLLFIDDTPWSICGNLHHCSYPVVLSLRHCCIIASVKPTKAAGVRPYPSLSILLSTPLIVFSDEAGSTPSQAHCIPFDPPEVSLQHLTTYTAHHCFTLVGRRPSDTSVTPVGSEPRDLIQPGTTLAYRYGTIPIYG